MFEPVQGYGGVIPLPSDYVRSAVELTQAIGGVVIADEVQTGVGRTGAHFFGFMEHGIVPDMVVLAKDRQRLSAVGGDRAARHRRGDDRPCS